MKLTITIPNRNRSWFFERSIYLLSKQTMSQNDWELIIVDDGSTDKTDEVIEKYRNMGIIKNFHYIRSTKKRDKSGNCAITRNIGAKFGTGDYILFSDPEVMVMPDWAEQHYLEHEGKLDREVIGYCIQPREYHIVTQKCRGPFLGNVYDDYNWYDIVNVWKIMNKKVREIQKNCGLSDFVINNEFFLYQGTQAGRSISRKFFYDVRGFEEDFTNVDRLNLDIWGGEDTLFGTYRMRNNITEIFSPKARAIHIYHDKFCRNCDACTYADKYAAEHPGQKQSNLGREWGLIEENGFKVIF